MQIKDRVFIVTGASSGIGLATAIALAERGAKVALLARSTDPLQRIGAKASRQLSCHGRHDDSLIECGKPCGPCTSITAASMAS